jgi:serine/threonine protein kinase
MQRIGRYEILGEVGRGAMGVVYRAQDPVIGRTIAIKTIRLTDIGDDEELQRLKERLFREARSAGILSHPHIVTIFDIGQEGDVAYIAMEFVNGDTLEKLMKSPHALSRQMVLDVLRQTAAALDYAHSKGIVHRDIKPANIMINENRAAKIADFGVAKILSQQITQADIVLGTPSYMSPEQIEAKGVDGRSDQFALGVISYQLLTGEKPFTGDTLPTLLYKIVKQDAQPLHQLNATLGAQVDPVLKKAMAKSSADRYPTCGEFVDALVSCLSASPGWRPQVRGSISNMPTATPVPSAEAEPTVTVVQSSSSGMMPPPAPPEQLEPTVVAVRPPAEPAPSPEPEPAPAPRRRMQEEGVSPSPFRGVLVAVLAIAVLGVAGYFGYENFFSQAPRTASEPSAEALKPQQTAPPVETPPPPPVVAETKPAPAPAPPPAVVQPPKPGSQRTAAAPEPLTVEIGSTPAGAQVSVEQSSEQCATPCSFQFVPGRYILRFQLAGYRPAVRILNVPQDLSANVRLERLGGTLMVKSTPPGALVLINGQPQAQRTPLILPLPVGNYKLVLRRDGVRDYEEDIQIKDQVISNIEVNWNQ